MAFTTPVLRRKRIGADASLFSFPGRRATLDNERCELFASFTQGADKLLWVNFADPTNLPGRRALVGLSSPCRVLVDEVTPISLPQMGFEEKYRPEYFCRLQRSNSNLTTSKVSKMVPEHGSAPWSPDSKSGILLARRLGN